jgi:predicted glycoside hydrolase/deacetylase ChbG (UPF0249 family)
VRGLLIVNADDFGGNRLATDRIVECFAAGAITSTSAMVYMSDSQRAAELGHSQELPIGLHLNVTQEFDDPATPAPVRERQRRLVRYFAGARLRRFTFNPVMHFHARRCVEDQLERFRQSFGREPTHIDGHKHGHLSPSVLPALARGIPVRTGLSAARGRRRGALGGVRHSLIAHRHPTTDHFFAINMVGQPPTDEGVEDLLALADRARVEVMVHPDRDYDYAILTSERWKNSLRRRKLGSFAEL